jgi:tellurite resistance protein TerC
VLDHIGVGGAEQGFELAELRRLEAARRIEPGTEAAELERVIVSSTSIWATITFRMDSTRFRVWTAGGLVVGVEQLGGVVELPQHLFEPQLVHLVDHDEQHLVVLGAVGARLLQREQLVDLEVRGVRQRGVGHVPSVVAKAAQRPPPLRFPMLIAAEEVRSDFADLDVPWWAWVALLAVIIAMLAIDLVRHRGDQEPTMRGALVESTIWVICGLSFGVVVLIAFGSQAFGEYISGYLIEKSLSVDNVFVWSMIFTTMAIPLKYQHRVLFWGIFGALTLRAVFIFAGSALIEQFWWLLLVFGVFLVYTGVKVIRHRDDEDQQSAHAARPASSHHAGDRHDRRPQRSSRDRRQSGPPRRCSQRSWCRGHRRDLRRRLGAGDPGRVAGTVLVFASNAFAILGLRAMYFLLAAPRRSSTTCRTRSRDPGVRRVQDGPVALDPPQHLRVARDHPRDARRRDRVQRASQPVRARGLDHPHAGRVRRAEVADVSDVRRRHGPVARRSRVPVCVSNASSARSRCDVRRGGRMRRRQGR